VKYAVESEYDIVPDTNVVPFKENEPWLIVKGFIFSLKVTAIVVLSGKLVASFAGFVDTTIGQTPIVSTNVSFWHAANIKIATVAQVVIIGIFFNLLCFKNENITLFPVGIHFVESIGIIGATLCRPDNISI
jgi:hypothetical protein